MEFQPQQEHRIRTYFRISIFLKGLISLTEIIAGVLILFVPLSSVTRAIVHISEGRLAHDPDDYIAMHLIPMAHSLSLKGGLFIAVYLLSRGAVKLGLVFALLKNQLWAYPASLVVIGLFVLYQVSEIIRHYSGILVALSVFDLLVMWLIWREYEVLMSHRARQ